MSTSWPEGEIWFSDCSPESEYDPVYDRLDAMSPAQEEPPEGPEGDDGFVIPPGVMGVYEAAAAEQEDHVARVEAAIAGPEPGISDGITSESAERAAQQLVDTALSLLLESRQGRGYLDMHYWLQGRLEEAWRGR